jgi:carbonic anhydrase
MQESLKKLIEGNKRFAQGKSIHPNLSQELRNTLLSCQKPFAAIIACSDSRVPVEIIFDAGIGDLFVIRTAGHVLSKETLGSLEYAVKKLGVKFVMILGHDNCGAVKSALSIYQTKAYHKLSQNLQILLNHIYPVFDGLDMLKEDVLDEAIKQNIKYQVKDLMEKDSYLAQKIKKQKLMVVGAKYSLKTGLIEVFD